MNKRIKIHKLTNQLVPYNSPPSAIILLLNYVQKHKNMQHECSVLTLLLLF